MDDDMRMSDARERRQPAAIRQRDGVTARWPPGMAANKGARGAGVPEANAGVVPFGRFPMERPSFQSATGSNGVGDLLSVEGDSTLRRIAN